MFSKDWNKIYKKRQQLNHWPWTDLVSLLNRYCKKIIKNKKSNFLELGSGYGGNFLFFLQKKLNYYGLEASNEAIKLIKKRFPKLKKKIIWNDFTKTIPFKINFDVIFDRASVTHNDEKAIKKAINLSHKKLKKGGYYIAVDWFSTKHPDFLKGKQSEDKYTKTSYSLGQFYKAGKVHFFDKQQIKKIFRKFKIIHLEEKIIIDFKTSKKCKFSSWNVVAKKIKK